MAVCVGYEMLQKNRPPFWQMFPKFQRENVAKFCMDRFLQAREGRGIAEIEHAILNSYIFLFFQ